MLSLYYSWIYFLLLWGIVSFNRVVLALMGWYINQSINHLPVSVKQQAEQLSEFHYKRIQFLFVKLKSTSVLTLLVVFKYMNGSRRGFHNSKPMKNLLAP